MKHRIADGHIHLEDVAEGNFQRPKEMLDLIASKGVTDASLLAYMPFCDVVSNLRVLFWKENFTKMAIRAFGSFHEDDIYKGVPYEKQYEGLMALGCDGIKFIQMKPDRRRALSKGLNHPSYDRALSMMEERGSPAVIHSGDPAYFWDRSLVSEAIIKRGWFYGDGSYPSFESLYEEDFEMLRKHPRLHVTFAHFFFLSDNYEEAVRVLETYENVNFDLTPGWEMYLDFSKDPDRWQAFFEKYSSRIQFGTDSNDSKTSNGQLNDLVYLALTHDKSEYDMPIWGHRVRGLDLSERAIKKICYENYIDRVGSAPAPVNRPLLEAAAERVLRDIGDDGLVTSRWIKETILK